MGKCVDSFSGEAKAFQMSQTRLWYQLKETGDITPKGGELELLKLSLNKATIKSLEKNLCK
jgi:hypothetical protein